MFVQVGGFGELLESEISTGSQLGKIGITSYSQLSKAKNVMMKDWGILAAPTWPTCSSSRLCFCRHSWLSKQIHLIKVA